MPTLKAPRCFVFALALSCARTGATDIPNPVIVTFVDGGSNRDQCPATVQGGGCNENGARCELGDNVDPRCNRQSTCESGSWRDTPAESETCATGPCADSPAALEGRSCTPGAGSLCAFAGTVCGCANAEAGTPVYACHPTALPCPHRRPPFGGPCVREQTCDYGRCGIEGSVRVACSAGAWRALPLTCP